MLLWLAGCSNNPHVAPWKTARPDGEPWITSYRGFSDDPRTLDPQVAYDELSHRVLSLTYDNFLTYDPFKKESTLIPGLAAELPVREDLPDGKVSYLCKLKPGIYFHDDVCFPDGKGRELTSEDFHYVFKRIADPKVQCPIASTLAEFLDGIGERYEAAQKTGTFDYDAPVGAITVVDRYTFRINLRKPYPQIKYWLAFAFTSPVAREAVEYYDGKVHDGKTRDLFRFHPVGTGPFKIAQWERGRLIRLIKNERYTAMKFPEGGWEPEEEARLRPYAGAALPIIDEIQLLPTREIIPLWTLFKQGYVEGIGVSKDTFNAVLGPDRELVPLYRERGVVLNKEVEMSTWYMMFNMQDKVLGPNRKLRQAMSVVFDAEAMNDIFRNGIALTTQQLLPPGIFGFDPNLVNPYRQTNVEKARQLMVEAGYPGGIDPKTGKPLELVMDTVADSGLSRQMAEFEKGQYEQLGIKVRIEENMFATMLKKQETGDFQFVSAGWNADYPDAENYFFLLYGPNQPPQGYNQARYTNPEFDKLFEKMATMENTPERYAIIQEMNRILIEDCVIAPLITDVSYILFQPWAKPVAKNTIISKFGGARYSILDTALREQKRGEWNHRSLWPAMVAGAALVGFVAWGLRKKGGVRG